MVRGMFSPIEPFDSYGALLQRLLPPIAHALIAGADGSLLWASDASAQAALQSTRSMLIPLAALAPAGVDGLAGPDGPDSDTSCYGFCVRGAQQGPLAFVLVAVRNEQGSPMNLETLHAHIRPAIECLQIELSARTVPARDAAAAHAENARAGRAVRNRQWRPRHRPSVESRRLADLLHQD
jgi:hypothetical protein